MIVEFIQNISILVALTVVHQLIVNCWPRHSLIYKILSGVLFGGVGIIGMMAPVHFVPGVIFDGRSIIMSLAGLFGGPLVAIISGAMCVIYRFSLGGAGAFPGALVIVAAAGLGVLMYFLKRREPGFLRPLSLWAFGGLVHGIMLLLMLLIPGVGLDALEKITLPILLVYPVVTVLICRILIEHEEAAKSDEELREREELLARSQEIAHVGSWELDLTNSCLKWSDETYRIFGVKPQEFDATYAGFMKFVHPDDRAKVDAAFAASLREKECYDVEHRIVRKHTGEVRHVYERCAHERNGSCAVCRDRARYYGPQAGGGGIKVRQGDGRGGE
jgi:PAS domain S-box-containing protein